MSPDLRSVARTSSPRCEGEAYCGVCFARIPSSASEKERQYFLWRPARLLSVPAVGVKTDYRWVRMTTDLSAAMRRDSQAQLSVTDYLRSLRRALEWAMFAPDGPAPPGLWKSRCSLCRGRHCDCATWRIGRVRRLSAPAVYGADEGAAVAWSGLTVSFTGHPLSLSEKHRALTNPSCPAV